MWLACVLVLLACLPRADSDTHIQPHIVHDEVVRPDSAPVPDEVFFGPPPPPEMTRSSVLRAAAVNGWAGEVQRLIADGVSVDAMDAAVHELEKSGAVPMAKQPKASSKQTKLTQQSRQASATLDALKAQSKKMRAGTVPACYL